jgi:hypothetical protein
LPEGSGGYFPLANDFLSTLHDLNIDILSAAVPFVSHPKIFKIPNKSGSIGRNFGFVSRFLAYTQKKCNEV